MKPLLHTVATERAVLETSVGVLFTDGEDYLNELQDDEDLIERGIVRVQKMTRPSGDGAHSEVFVESQAIVAGRLVELCQRCGTLWGIGDADQKTHERARDDLAWLRGELEKLGFDVRSGAWVRR